MVWKKGALKSATITGEPGKELVLYHNGKKRSVRIPDSGVLQAM